MAALVRSVFLLSVLALANVLCHQIQPRNDDTNPNSAIIQTLASKLNLLEAELATQNQKVSMVEAELATQKQKVSTVETELNAQKQKVTVLEDKLGRKVAFTVLLESDHDVTISDGGLLPFNKITLNVGNGYNSNSLSFTSPYEGNYWFYVRIDETDFRSFEIRRNGVALNRCDNDAGLRAVTCGVVAFLKLGDTVTVNHQGWGSNAGSIDPGPESLFSGFLIQ